MGAVERESMIETLHDEALRFDERMNEARAAMLRVEDSKRLERELADRQALVGARSLSSDVAYLERKLDELRAELQACHLRLAETMEDERAQIVAHLQRSLQ